MMADYTNYLTQAELDDALTYVAVAGTMTLNTNEQVSGAMEFLRKIEKRGKELNDRRMSHTRPLDEEKKGIMAWFAPATDAMERASKVLRARVLAFQQQQQRIAREAQAKLDAEAAAARKKIEDKRRADEQKEREKRAELQRQAEAAESEKERAAFQKRLEALRQRGAEKDAEVEVKVAQVVAPVVIVEAPKVTGVSGRQTWKWRAVDPALIPDKYWILNEQLINAEVRALKSQTRIPGIEAFAEDGLSVRS